MCLHVSECVGKDGFTEPGFIYVVELLFVRGEVHLKCAVKASSVLN